MAIYTRNKIKKYAREYLAGDNRELEFTIMGLEADVELRDKRVVELEQENEALKQDISICVEECASISETQERGTDYDWVSGSLWDNITKRIALQIRGVKWVVRSCEPKAKEVPDKITVCDACLTASCWKGEFMCEDAVTAGTTEKTAEELKELALEHPDHWLKKGE